MTFGERVRELRKKHGLSIRSLGKKLGVADSYLSRVERNLVPASDKLLLSLTEEFQAPELFRLAGKIMSTDFMLDSGWREKIIKVNDEIDKEYIKSLYPSEDPYTNHSPHDKHKLPNLLTLDEDTCTALHDIGFTPEMINIYPPLRDALIKLSMQQQPLSSEMACNGSDVPIEENIELVNKILGFDLNNFLNNYASFYLLQGKKEGIISAIEILTKLKDDHGDYFLLAAFYDHNIAEMLSNALDMIKDWRNNPPRKKKTKQKA